MVGDGAAGHRADPVGQRVPQRPGARGGAVAAGHGGVDEARLLLGQGGAGGADDPLEEAQGGGVDLLDHAGADDEGAGVQGRGEAVELVLQEGEALGDADEEDVDPLRRGVPGGEQAYSGGLGGAQAGPGEVGAGGGAGEVGVADLDRPAGGEGGGEGAPAVEGDDERAVAGAGQGAGLREVAQEVGVGGVPGAELVADLVRQQPAAGTPERRIVDAYQSFLDTAAIIRNLDLVITVDTSTAHLAGALGVPVWLLLGRVPDWRWLQVSETTPWYPGMRLFRQAHLGQWTDVFAQVVHALRSAAANSRDTGHRDRST